MLLTECVYLQYYMSTFERLYLIGFYTIWNVFKRNQTIGQVTTISETFASYPCPPLSHIPPSFQVEPLYHMVDLPDLYIKTQVKASLKLPRVALIIFYVKMIVLYCHNFKYQRFLSTRNLFLPFVSKLLTKDLFFLRKIPLPFPQFLYVWTLRNDSNERLL